MKRIISLVLSLALATILLASCQATVSTTAATTAASSAGTTAATTAASTTVASTQATTATNSTAETPAIRIGGLKGATSIGMVQLMENAEKGTSANPYEFTIAGAADELTPKLIQGDLDIAAVPANLASILYNNTKGAIRLLAVNTLGVIYIVERDETVRDFSDLRGRTIYSTGKGTAPEYAMRYLFEENGLDPDQDVTFEWKSEPAEVVALLSESKDRIAMLPQPYVTVAQTKLSDLRVALDLNQAWSDLDNNSLMITGVLIVRSEFANEHPDELAAFLNEYKESTTFVNNNIPQAASLVEKFNIFSAAVAAKAIPSLNITYLDGAEMKTAMQGYLNVLFERNPKSIGGAMPGDDFYYAR